MKLLSAALLGCLTTTVIANAVNNTDGTVEDSDEARRRNRPKCKGPNCPRPCKGPNCPGKSPPPKKGKAPVKKAPVKKAPPPKRGKAPPPKKKAPPPKKGKAPPPKKGKSPPPKKAPKRAPPAKKAPPCKGRNCPRPCKGPNCPGNKGASNKKPFLNKVADRHVIHTTTGLATPVPAERDPYFVDDVFYPKPLLQKMAAKGLNVSGLKTITGMYSAEHAASPAARGLVQHLKWDERDPVDNKIVVPYSFHADYPADFKAAAIAAYDKMNGDLGCIKTKYIDESLVSVDGAPHTNGIWIAYQDLTGGGCYSALGKAPGFAGRSPHTMNELGAPSGWQIMSYGTMDVSSCSGLDEGTLMHEMLHALGVKHEHARPDREQFLNVDMDATEMDSQFTLIDTESWIQVFDDAGNDRYPYETVSVMHYCSMCGASGSDPVMTYKDGTIFGSGEFMTTTDSLQIIWAYCNADADQGNPKETIPCQSLDKFDLARPVYTDRVCDGRFDCFGGEDEIDGSMAVCIPESTLDSGCCGAYWVGGVEFVYQEGTDFNGHGTWANPNDTNEIILRWSSGTWYRGTAGNPQVTGQGFSYMALSEGVNSNNAACPPTDTSWQTLGGDQYSVLCKSSGAQFNTVNECEDGTANCDPVATCTDTVAGFTCECPSTHSGDGTTCTEIVLEDECANGNNNCPEVCTDQQIGFTCSCQDGQFDVNGDGLTCTDVEPCCEVFKIGLAWPNYKLLCTHERTHSGTGMMDYNCVADPDHADTPSGFTFPVAVQFIANLTPSGYFLTNGSGVIPENAGGVSVSYFTTSQPPAGAICPSMNTADWAQTSGQDWLLECVTFVTPETPSDPDQCADGSHNCHQSATCTNTDDGFTCACLEGFGGDGVTCTELVDECATGTHNCDPNAFCTNTPAAFDCVCNDGFDGDGFSCTQTDVNECEDGTHQCDTTISTCVNNEGSYNCDCIPSDFTQQIDTITCGDIDECAAGDPCNTANQSATCTNIVNQGFTCECGAGFVQDTNANSFTCLDVNECETANICPTGSVCTNLPGTFQCDCGAGFTFSDDGCLDNNECEMGSHNCGIHQCVNNHGSFDCACPAGFTWDATNLTCMDNDECSTSDPCLLDMNNAASCVNSEGSFECVCNAGYTQGSDGVSCEDIDECTAAIDGCNISAGVPAQCFNFDGGFECECATGYIASTDQARSTGFHCIDVNECDFGDVCNANQGNPATCVNIDGGFECQCNQGFSADSSGQCLDQNECENNPCPTGQDCVNVEGGFECLCGAGWTMGTDGICVDDDECLTDRCGLADGNAAVCTNTEGSYQCDCEQGYLVDDNGWCNDIDECNLFRMRVSCSANTDCVNTPGSFECTCKDGFAGEQRTFGTVCVDVDECADGSHNCNADMTCLNVPGSFACECPTGTTQVNNADGTISCSQNDPCANVECQAGFTCVANAAGEGFCEDIDECAAGASGAADCANKNADCNNTPGSYECVCPSTLAMGPNGDCVDLCTLHECQTGQTCVETELAGIAFAQCEDIDECAAATNPCGPSSVCTNSPGSFICTCQSGFTLQTNADGTSSCVDACAVMTCPAEATCHQGQCICPAGSTLDEDASSTLICSPDVTDPCAGVTCPDNSVCNAAGVCQCNDGFLMNENADSTLFCDPINPDLCAGLVCPENGFCSATGECMCDTGFALSSDGMFCDPINQDLCTGVTCDAGLACEGGQCVDVDECADGSHMCDSFETCVNENGSYSCTFDHSVCPESQVVWKGAKFGRVFYRGEKSIELRVTITNKNIDVRDSTYFGMLMFGKKKCGGDFLRALSDGRVQVDVMDADHIYNVVDVYHRDDSGQSSTQILFNLFDTTTMDHPFSKKKGENTKKDQMYFSFWNLDTVNFGNKDWEECLEKATVGAVQSIESGNENFTNACATWQKTLWN